MNDENLQSIAAVFGESIGDVLFVFLEVVNALRKQPSFDDTKFCAEIQALLQRSDFSDTQREALSSLLRDSE
ncbi:hypothetical protein ACN4EG_18560 [Alkalinema pantanalense CENA528]|uniref:hypothetical protein n=1 Tax=Alkalinema pantanalense TaxID=1620705 RepID=UPI003D6FFDC0